MVVVVVVLLLLLLLLPIDACSICCKRGEVISAFIHPFSDLKVCEVYGKRLRALAKGKVFTTAAKVTVHEWYFGVSIMVCAA